MPPRERCLGCGYYREELDENKPCEGGHDHQAHVFVEVDADGMAIPRPTHAIHERSEKGE